MLLCGSESIGLRLDEQSTNSLFLRARSPLQCSESWFLGARFDHRCGLPSDRVRWVPWPPRFWPRSLRHWSLMHNWGVSVFEGVGERYRRHWLRVVDLQQLGCLLRSVGSLVSGPRSFNGRVVLGALWCSSIAVTVAGVG